MNKALFQIKLVILKTHEKRPDLIKDQVKPAVIIIVEIKAKGHRW
jgi:hypothetical protein